MTTIWCRGFRTICRFPFWDTLTLQTVRTGVRTLCHHPWKSMLYPREATLIACRLCGRVYILLRKSNFPCFSLLRPGSWNKSPSFPDPFDQASQRSKKMVQSTYLAHYWASVSWFPFGRRTAESLRFRLFPSLWCRHNDFLTQIELLCYCPCDS